MSGDGDHFWLGLNPIQPSTNRVAVPKPVFEAGLLRESDDAFWGHRTDEARVVVSYLKKPFLDQPEYTHNFTTSVQANRVVTIPKQFFEEYEGKADYAQGMSEDLRFRLGETLHFVVSSRVYRRDLCYVLNDEDGRALIDESMRNLVPDGGWDERLDAAEEDVVLPEAIVGDNEVLHLETGEILTVEEMIERLEGD